LRDTIIRTAASDPLLKVAARAAKEAGGGAFLVGGTVRDLALGRVPSDLDLACGNAKEAAVRAARVLGSRVVTMGRGRLCTWRAPAGERFVDWAPLAPGGIVPDLERRDFTVNAIALNLESDAFVDPCGGLGDLSARVLRMTSPEALSQDPLRILRAYRLLATLDGFTLDGPTREAMAERAQDLPKVAAERVRHELELILASPSPGGIVRSMSESGVLCAILPELEPLRGLAQNNHHHTDALNHTLEAVEAVDGPPAWVGEMGLTEPDAPALALARLAILLHDVGKVSTSSVGPDGAIHFYGHPKISSDLAHHALRRLRFPRDTEEAVGSLCLNHQRPLGLVKSGAGRTAMRRLVHDMGRLAPHLLVLAYADKSASHGRPNGETLRALRELSVKVQEVGRQDGPELARLPKLVGGLEALEVLGMSRPGPDLGRALDALMERQVAGEVRDRNGALAFLRRYRERHPA
jgi:tRNA nucleotidyltransferase/poly(A) polymerase